MMSLDMTQETETQAAFPTAPIILSSTDTDGTLREYWFSPPVLSGKKAHRYAATRRTAPDGQISIDFFYETCRGWTGWKSKDSWAACTFGAGDPAGRYYFERVYEGKQPLALQKKWYPDLARFLHAHDPAALAQRLKDYDSMVKYQAAKDKTMRTARALHEFTYGKIEDGDVAVTQRGYNYASHLGEEFGDVHLFVMRKVQGKKGLHPHIWMPKGRCLIAVRVTKARYDTFMKIGPKALAEIKGLSQHGRIALMAQEQEIRAYLDGIAKRDAE